MAQEPCALVCDCPTGSCAEPPCHTTCGSGFVCERDTGLCIVPKTADEPCGSAGDCQDGLYCDWSSTDTCKPRGGVGSPCAFSEHCASGRCDETLGECTEPAIAGTPCVDSSDCGGGVPACIDGFCAAKRGAGGSCSEDSHCGRPGFCLEGVCTVIDRCTIQGLGEPCLPGGCGTGTYCPTSSAQQRCTLRLGLNETCDTVDQSCEDGAFCDANTIRCTALRLIDEPCNADYACADEGAFCDYPSLTCQLPRPDGVSCEADSQCASGSCVSSPVGNVCGQPTCSAG